MKKTRLLAFLITVCLTTTCLLTGTVAKYSTSDAAADQGTVAKWGIQLNVSGVLFGEKYTIKDDDENTKDDVPTFDTTVTGDTLTVISDSEGKKVVAPGTKSDKPLNISLTGTAETDLKITFSVDNDNNELKDIFLKEGEYAVMVDVTAYITAENFVAMVNQDNGLYSFATNTYTKLTTNGQIPDTYSNTAVYYVPQNIATVSNTDMGASGFYNPVVYKITNNNNPTDPIKDEKFYTVEDLMNRLEGIIDALDNNNSDDQAYVEANSNTLDIDYDITWEWVFEQKDGENVDTNIDNCDTILGILIANESINDPNAKAKVVKTGNTEGTYVAIEESDYNTTTAFNFEIKVEQVD